MARVIAATVLLMAMDCMCHVPTGHDGTVQVSAGLRPANDALRGAVPMLMQSSTFGEGKVPFRAAFNSVNHARAWLARILTSWLPLLVASTVAVFTSI
jgi:hypothetical protein